MRRTSEERRTDSTSPQAASSTLRGVGDRAVLGVAWLGGGQMVRMGVSFITQILLARMLLPTDFGLFGMAYMAAELAQLFAAFGVGAAIIQKQTTNSDVLSSCFWINILIGLVIGVVLVVSGPLVEVYFRTEGVGKLMWPLAANMVVCAAMVVPQALLTQRLLFREQMKAQIVGSGCSAIAAVIAAFSGAGVWTLAIQPLVGNLVTALFMMAQSNWRPSRRLRMRDVQPLLKLSTQLLLNSFVEWFARSLPGMIIGRQLGAAAVGAYAMATGLTGVVVYQISSIITRVLFPTLAVLRTDPDVMRMAWRKSISAIAIAAWPLMASAVAVAPDFVPVVFGQQWQASIRPFQALCLLMAFQCVAFTANTVLLALGQTDILLKLTLTSTVVFAAALWLGALYGLDEAASAYALAGIFMVLLTFVVAAKQCQVPLGDLLRELRPWGQAALLIGLAMAGLAHAMAAAHQVLRLVACVALGAVLYPSLLMLFDRKRTLEIVQDVATRLFRK